MRRTSVLWRATLAFRKNGIDAPVGPRPSSLFLVMTILVQIDVGIGDEMSGRQSLSHLAQKIRIWRSGRIRSSLSPARYSAGGLAVAIFRDHASRANPGVQPESCDLKVL